MVFVVKAAPWLFPAMQRVEADRILTQFGYTLSVPIESALLTRICFFTLLLCRATCRLTPGLFLMRVKDSSKGAYVLSMVLSNRQTIHHLIERGLSGAYLVNGEVFANHTTLVSLVHALRSPQ
jgi:hypothetical protein